MFCSYTFYYIHWISQYRIFIIEWQAINSKILILLCISKINQNFTINIPNVYFPFKNNIEVESIHGFINRKSRTWKFIFQMVKYSRINQNKILFSGQRGTFFGILNFYVNHYWGEAGKNNGFLFTRFLCSYVL